ncbi:MAG: hypothetical protein ACSW8H_03435, partial [bacterium]
YGPDYWKKLLIGGLPFPGADKAFLRTRQFFCYCLYGPAGAGQRNLSLAFAADCQRAGYQAYDLPGHVLRGENLTETYTLVAQTFAEARKAPSVLIIENPGNRMVLECILSECERIDLREPVKVIVTEEDENVLCEGLKSVFFLCKFELPDEEERTAFFEKYLPLVGNDEPTPAGMASETGGLSYDELLQLVNILRLQMKAAGVKYYLADKKKGLSEEELEQAMTERRERGEIAITMDLFEDSLVMLRQQKLQKRQEDVPGLRVILEGGLPLAASLSPGIMPVYTAAPAQVTGTFPAANSGTDDEDLEKKSRDKVLEDLNQRFERRGGQ